MATIPFYEQLRFAQKDTARPAPEPEDAQAPPIANNKKHVKVYRQPLIDVMPYRTDDVYFGKVQPM